MDAPEPIAAWLWASGSLLLSILWTNLTWFFRQPRPDTANEIVSRLTNWRFAPSLLQFLRLLYYIGLPYGALLWGRDAVIASLLGLGGKKVDVTPAANWLDWAYDVGWTAALGIVAWALLALGWRAYRRALGDAGSKSPVAGADASGWALLREAAFHEVHWAFYRNAPLLTLGAYWGIWGGLAMAALEAALNPVWRKGLADPQKAPAQLMRGALAVVSGALFWQTHNLWLAVMLHWGVSWGLALCAKRET
ncbi:MAG: hypothetical protein B6I35_03960 [Anaerolineaceae bacterium 4572_32.2]|nr:MAG: hypothetical protein B6I35_03960 [Anaerolineaceae bacterium 4572_32.2]